MNKTSPSRDFFKILEELNKKSHEGDLLFKDFIAIIGDQSHWLLILFLTLPFLQPIPLVGLSTPVGMLICFIALLKFWGKKPQIPEKLGQRKISRAILLKTSEVALKFWRRLENIIKPRCLFLFEGKGYAFLNFIIVSFSAFLLSLPLPIPFTNTVPAVCIVLHSFAQLEKDGYVLLASYLIFAATLFYFSSLAVGIAMGLEFLNR